MEAGTIISIIIAGASLTIAILAGYGKLRDLIDDKHTAVMRKLDNQTDGLDDKIAAVYDKIGDISTSMGSKMDEHRKELTTACQSLARLEENNKDHERRLARIENKVTN